ncbi:hypothetical protein LTR97_001742 [Elasticomyces elasticus]|uniref:Uncharacterized protein n=1 Tax=Elasticomyces elasticus TaxID=574655 RepID=A0AAN8A584_9PEZI|nr:hypothetical protein LTR97_001742 [Elasticomyces elasticus]
MGTYNEALSPKLDSMGQGKHNPGPQDSHVTTNDTAWNITPPDDDDEGHFDSKQEAMKVQDWLKETEARAAKHNDRPSFIQYLYKVSKYNPLKWEYQAWIYAHPEDIEAVEALLQPGDRESEPESTSTDFEALGDRMGDRKVEEMQRECFGNWNFGSAGDGPGLTDIVGPFMMDETLEMSEQQQNLTRSSVTVATHANPEQGARGTTQADPIVIDDDDEQEPRVKRLKLRHGSVEGSWEWKGRRKSRGA